MKKSIAITLFISGIITMLTFAGCSNGGFKYLKYVSSNPRMGISMDYIEGWKFLERAPKDKGYLGVLFVKPNTTGKFEIYIEAKAVDITAGPGVKQLSELVEDQIQKDMKFADAKLLYKKDIKLLGEKAIDYEVSFKLIDSLHRLDAKRIPQRIRMVSVKKGERLYFLKMQVREEDYGRYNKAFSHIIKSFRVSK